MGFKKLAKKAKRCVKMVAHPKRAILHPNRAWRATKDDAAKAEYHLAKIARIGEKAATSSMSKEQRAEYEEAKSDLKKANKLLKKADKKKGEKADELKAEGNELLKKAMSVLEKLDLEFDPVPC